MSEPQEPQHVVVTPWLASAGAAIPDPEPPEVTEAAEAAEAQIPAERTEGEG